jgi:hypothetical protein
VEASGDGLLVGQVRGNPATQLRAGNRFLQDRAAE